jgi:predicted AAA+ superfamily ATPase
MHGYVSRHLEGVVARRLRESPVVALLGPRQCGKTTLAQHIVRTRSDAIHLDLERPSQMRRLADPEAYFELHRDELVCIDEIQRAPDLFAVMRSVVDERRQNGQFLVLGSASPELLRQSSESLAGRIGFLELTPFLLPEVTDRESRETLQALWLRGGFPRSFLAADDRRSFEWRRDFVQTFLERDMARHAPRIPADRLGTLWRICAHEQGQLLNLSKVASALGVSAHTVRSYIGLLEATFMLRQLPPCEADLKKRLVKSPKVFVRDSGILHALLEIRDHDGLLGHPVRGMSWESMVIEQVTAALPEWRASFYRTQSGAEIDLVLELGRRRVAVECKASSAPEPTRGFWNALEDLAIKEVYVVAPVAEAYPIAANAAVVPLDALLRHAPAIDTGASHPAIHRR